MKNQLEHALIQELSYILLFEYYMQKSNKTLVYRYVILQSMCKSSFYLINYRQNRVVDQIEIIK